MNHGSIILTGHLITITYDYRQEFKKYFILSVRGQEAETKNNTFQQWWVDLLPIRNSENHQNKALPSNDDLALVQEVYSHYSKIIDFSKYEKNNFPALEFKKDYEDHLAKNY